MEVLNDNKEMLPLSFSQCVSLCHFPMNSYYAVVLKSELDMLGRNTYSGVGFTFGTPKPSCVIAKL
jgi:hypothetical protein